MEFTYRAELKDGAVEYPVLAEIGLYQLEKWSGLTREDIFSKLGIKVKNIKSVQKKSITAVSDETTDYLCEDCNNKFKAPKEKFTQWTRCECGGKAFDIYRTERTRPMTII